MANDDIDEEFQDLEVQEMNTDVYVQVYVIWIVKMIIDILS